MAWKTAIRVPSAVRAFRLQVRRAPGLGVLGVAELEGDHDF